MIVEIIVIALNVVMTVIFSVIVPINEVIVLIVEGVTAASVIGFGIGIIIGWIISAITMITLASSGAL
ncbi:MAG: hypothetical protein R2867_22175 [Caldilineaceae bacterium]